MSSGDFYRFTLNVEVQVMPMFELPQEIRVTYLLRRRQDLEELRESLRTHNAEVFRRLGHQIKGSARSYGFESLESLALEMDSLEPSEIASKGPRIIVEFESWIESQFGQFKKTPSS